MEISQLEDYESWSRPARGAWIEMLPLRMIPLAVLGRAPHGARGLKFVVKSNQSGY